jgi:hypothetical protein
MTRIDLPTKTICWNPGGPQLLTWDASDTYCDNNFRAQLCTLGQWRAAVCRAGVSNPGRSWTNQVTGSGSFAFIFGCSGEQVGSLQYNSGLQGPCCLEWPRY